MPYTFTLTTTIPASAQEIYDAWLDSLAHSEMTGSTATMSDEIGAEISAWGGYITGRNLELVPGERIVQTWRTSEFGEEAEDSIITVTLEESEDGTLLTLEHSNVPEEQKSYEEGGWQESYFEPMLAYFSERQQGEEGADEEPEIVMPEAPPKRARKGAAKGAAKAAAKPAAGRGATSGKAKSAASARGAAPRARKAVAKKAAAKKAVAKKAVAKKAAAKKRKTARTAAAARRPGARKAKSKSARGRRR